MATQTLTYTSTTLLDCASSSLGCTPAMPADIILCVDSSLVAQGECLITLEDTDFVYNTIPAIVYSYYPFKKCGVQYYEYTIAYDDENLIPDTNLVCTDILGIICEGCLTTFIRDYAGQEVSIQTIEGVQTLVTQHGCQYPIVTSGYSWTFTGDSGGVQTVDNLDNVEYIGGASIATTSGAGEQLTIDLELSADAGQLLGFGTDNNIFLECADLETCDAFTVQGDGGPQQTVLIGGNLTIEGNGVITTQLSAPGIVTITTPVGAGFSIPLVADAGTAETITQGGSLSILGTGAATTTTSATNVVTIDVPVDVVGVIGDTDIASENPAEDISAVGTYGPFAATGLLTYNNPSATNSITVYYIVEYETGLQAVESAGNFIGRLSINGGGLTSVGNFFYTTNNALGADQPHTLRTQQVGIATIVGGGSLTLEADQTIDIVNPAAGAADWLTAQTTVTVYGTNII